ncbi:unnamed protein product [[Actinomadura] parvosata subsp. kistnae]|nr:unnamed protein product [Actinomadura parvosata subsp. kistnae]
MAVVEAHDGFLAAAVALRQGRSRPGWAWVSGERLLHWWSGNRERVRAAFSLG